MPHVFVIDLEYLTGLDEVDRHLADHREFLTRNYAAGTFLASGRKDPRTGGVILAKGDRATIKEVVATDPFYRHGVARYTITAFVPTMTADGLAQLLSDDDGG